MNEEEKKLFREDMKNDEEDFDKYFEELRKENKKFKKTSNIIIMFFSFLTSIAITFMLLISFGVI